MSNRAGGLACEVGPELVHLGQPEPMPAIPTRVRRETPTLPPSCSAVRLRMIPEPPITRLGRRPRLQSKNITGNHRVSAPLRNYDPELPKERLGPGPERFNMPIRR
jgi:hypothetical protein